MSPNNLFFSRDKTDDESICFAQRRTHNKVMISYFNQAFESDNVSNSTSRTDVLLGYLAICIVLVAFAAQVGACLGSISVLPRTPLWVSNARPNALRYQLSYHRPPESPPECTG